jgi:regulator of nonsense transcripts 2
MSDNENDSQYLEGISSHNSPHLNLSSDDEDLQSVNDSASDVYSLSEHDDASDHEDADQQSEDDDLDDFDMINEEEMERKLREEEDEEFDREFNLMMAQSLDSRKYDRKTKLQDIQLPTRLGELKSAKIDPSQNRVAFTVLTKKTGKGQSSSSTISSKFLEVPSECSLAVNTLNRQEQERQEQIQLKKMVLDFEVQQDMQERKDFQQTLARHGVNLTNSSFASPDSPSNGQSTFTASSPSTKYRNSRNFKKI